jgi:hypothetical protein
MHALGTTLRTVHVQASVLKIDLAPTQRAKLCGAAVPIRQQDCAGIAFTVPPTIARSVDQAIDFRFGQIFAWPIRRVGPSQRQCSICRGWRYLGHCEILL